MEKIKYKMEKEEKYMVKTVHAKSITKIEMGKKSRQAGARFELKVREDLEKKGWIVAKWSNNVEFHNDEDVHDLPFTKGKLVKVKNKFLGPGKPMMLGAGFPDFIAFKTDNTKVPYCDKNNNCGHLRIEHIGDNTAHCLECDSIIKTDRIHDKFYEVMAVESKSNGYLDKDERAKCKWLLDSVIFSKILIAQKGEKRGEIIYKEYFPKEI